MKTVAYFSLVILSLVAIISLPLTVSALVFDSLFGKPYQSIEYMKGHAVYAEFAADLREQFATQELSETNPILRAAVKKSVDQVLTDAYVTAKLEQLQRHFWDYVMGKTAAPEPVSLYDLQVEFTKQVEAVMMPAPLRALVLENIDRQLPRELTFAMITDRDAAQTAALKEQYLQYRLLLKILTAITLICWAALIFLRHKMAVSRLWLSVPLFLSAGLHALPWIPYLLLKNRLTERFADADFDRDFAIGQLFLQMASDFATWVSVFGGLFAVISVLILLRLFQDKRAIHERKPFRTE